MLDIRWRMVFCSLMFVLICFIGQSCSVDIISSTNSVSYMVTSISMQTVSPSPTPFEEEETDESFVQANLGLIIGVPTGIGISIFGFIGCLIYCGVNAVYQNYRDNHDNQPTGSVDYSHGTASTGVRSNMYTSGQNSSAYQSSAFEPSAGTLPRYATNNQSSPPPTESTSAV